MEETMVITVPALTIVEIRVVGELEDAIIITVVVDAVVVIKGNAIATS